MERRHPVVYFDGICLLCTRSVQFLLKLDKRKRFRFASLQGEAGRNLLLREGLDIESCQTFLLEWNGRVYRRSDAALLVFKLLGGIWIVFYACIIIPRPLRDAVYGWIARNRYRWFGTHTSCWIPTPEWNERFIP